MRAEPFHVDLPQAELDELHRRLDATRWADDFGNEDWRYGVEAGWLREMVRYWRHDYDWRAEEARINAVPQYRVVIDDIPIHFVHVRGKGPNPRPLLLTHGWPWTFWDYRKVIGPLTDPAAHGGDPAQSFDLVIPSLPGYGFSVPLRKTGIDVPAIARLWTRLMTDVLGYERFGAAGGDWGAPITAQLGHAHDAHVTGVYMTLVVYPGLDLAALTPDAFAPDEAWMVRRMAEAAPTIASHITVQSSDPQTLAYAMVDSPVGTAAWLWERRRAWSDCNGDVLSAYTRDDLCTLAMLYWMNGSIGTSFRLYYEHFRNGWITPPEHDRKPVIAVPTGYGIFPRDVAFAPRAVVARDTNLARWTIMPSGGHFAPFERPDLVSNELRTFFSAIG